MKNLAVAFFVVFSCLNIYSQEDGYQCVNKYTNAGFYTSINVNPGLYFHEIKIVTGPEFGMALGNFHFGCFFNTSFMNSENDTVRANTFFHGLTMGYSIMGKKPIHPLIKIYAGIGEINYKYHRQLNNSYFDYYSWEVFNTPIISVTPELSLEMNVAHFMKLSAGFYYRNIFAERTGGLFNNSDASGFGGIVRVSFGKFYTDITRNQ